MTTTDGSKASLAAETVAAKFSRYRPEDLVTVPVCKADLQELVDRMIDAQHYYGTHNDNETAIRITELLTVMFKAQAELSKREAAETAAAEKKKAAAAVVSRKKKPASDPAAAPATAVEEERVPEHEVSVL